MYQWIELNNGSTHSDLTLIAGDGTVVGGEASYC